MWNCLSVFWATEVYALSRESTNGDNHGYPRLLKPRGFEMATAIRVAEKFEALKGHGFSRAINATKMNPAFRPRGMVFESLAREPEFIRSPPS
jgi:hypothetical protein